MKTKTYSLEVIDLRYVGTYLDGVMVEVFASDGEGLDMSFHVPPDKDLVIGSRITLTEPWADQPLPPLSAA